MMSLNLYSVAMGLLLALSGSSAFVVSPTGTRRSSALFLEDWVADLIDKEMHRESHHKDFEKQWMEKNRNNILHHTEDFVDPDQPDDYEVFRQQAKDKKLALEDPVKYCADRCIATGNCDVYEDFFQLSPEQVLDFCNDCVLSENGENCVLPEAFHEVMAEEAAERAKKDNNDVKP